MFRCKVKVIGVSDRIRGTKENGKSYDFAKAAVEYTNEYGSKDVGVCLVSGDVVDDLPLISGGTYDAVVESSRYKFSCEFLEACY